MFSQAIYCGGYSGEEPPLPIPNREVKLTIADGTAPPGGRVGSCRSSNPRTKRLARGFFLSIPLRRRFACSFYSVLAALRFGRDGTASWEKRYVGLIRPALRCAAAELGRLLDTAALRNSRRAKQQCEGNCRIDKD